jgi:hypothetical protein
LHQKQKTYVTTDVSHKNSLFLPRSQEESVGVYFSSRQDDRERAIKTVSPEKAEKIIVRVAQIQEQIAPVNIPIKKDVAPPTKTFQTPVELRTKPENYVATSSYKNTISTVLSGNYFRDNLWNFPVIIDSNRVSPRGQMSNESITLSSKISSLSEMAKVLVHELAHMIDIYSLKQKNFTPDPSKEFYALSWSEPTVMKSGISSAAFVSGYASTNQYEDFAESFTFYVFHNRAF